MISAPIYADSSALVKLVIEEGESHALHAALADVSAQLVTSHLAQIEVTRAVRIANPDQLGECQRLLESCVQIDITADLVRRAVGLASARLRTLDAIHLATALRSGVESMAVYDERLAEAAMAAGFSVLQPGVGPPRVPAPPERGATP